MVLPKGMRLKGYKCFNYIHKYSKRYKGNLMILKLVKAHKHINQGKNKSLDSTYSCRCAISISNKVSKRAVVRNRLRRLLHEHLRKTLFHQPSFFNYWVLISLNTNCLNRDIKDLLDECDNLFFQAELYP